MFGRSRYVLAVALVFGVAVTTLSGHALAQAVTMSPTNPVKRDPPRTNTTTDTTVALTLTRGDCNDTSKVEYTFNVNLTGYKKSYTLEAWAGPADCAAQRNAIEANKQCWKLGELDVSNNTASATYKASELLGVGSNKPDWAILYTCNDKLDNTARQSFNVVFMLVATSTVQGTAATQQLYYDMSGPAAPKNVKVGVAESALKVNWSAVDDEGEINYKFYCTDAASNCESSFGDIGGSGGSGGDGGTSAGGTTSTGGSSTSGKTTTASTAVSGGASGNGGDSSSSTSTSIVGNQCGQVRGRANQSGFTTHLTNGKTYAVSVVAVDAYGNESEKSTPACGTPDFVDTFFEHYRNKGGKAGGSFCSFGHGQKQLYTASLLLLSLGAIASLRRRRANPNL